jgi:hypothetical protein
MYYPLRRIGQPTTDGSDFLPDQSQNSNKHLSEMSLLKQEISDVSGKSGFVVSMLGGKQRNIICAQEYEEKV